MRCSKFDIYRSIYEELKLKFEGIPEKKLKNLMDSWSISFAQMDSWLSDPQQPVSKSKLVTSLEQGLIDTYCLISELPDTHRVSASRTFLEVCSQYEQNFLVKIDKKFNKILFRGKIRNESEWYLIRSKVDELSFSQQECSDLKKYQALLDDFEFNKVICKS